MSASHAAVQAGNDSPLQLGQGLRDPVQKQQRISEIWCEEHEVAARPQDPAHLAEHDLRTLQVLQHPEADDQVE